MNLAENLKRIRKENNLSQEQLAEKLGVSRQSVSKWESNQAYPEMDKVLQICQMFSLNIDDLLNQNIKEVNNNKQSKNNVNKFIDDFLDFITKTIDMFSSMKFKEKIKCIFEQIFIGGILALILLIIGAIGSAAVSNIIMLLPDQIYYIIFNMIESIYFCLSFILIIVLIIYIFKVRYLDYYVVIKSSDTEEKLNKEIDNNYKENELELSNAKKIILEKRKEKVIIRDPKHSGYKLITGLLRIAVNIFKFLAFLIGIFFCLTLICFCFFLIVLFLFVKTELIFLGALLIILACIIINIIALVIIYHFIISKKNNKSLLAVSIVISLASIGFGLGFISIGLTDFNYVDNNKNFVQDEIIINMKDGIFFGNYNGDLNYVESNEENLRIVYKHHLYTDVVMLESQNEIYFYPEVKNVNIMKLVRSYIKNLNDKEVVDYSKYDIYIYTTKENIEKLKNNRENYYLLDESLEIVE